jgi:hypothetical protein
MWLQPSLPFIRLGVEVKTCIVSHPIAYELRKEMYIVMQVVLSMKISIIYLQSYMFKMLLNQLLFN